MDQREVELNSPRVYRLIAAGLLFRQGAPPHATYLFKHALVRHAAYGTLLREPRRALHARIAKALESEFADLVERQPELLARHCTEAGLIEKAAALVGQGRTAIARSLGVAGGHRRRSHARSTRLPPYQARPALRREQIKLQVALLTPLIHVKGYAAPETKAAAEQARLLIEQAEAIGEPPEDPLAALFAPVRLFGSRASSRSSGDMMRELAAHFLALAEKQGSTVPADGRAPKHGCFPVAHGRYCKKRLGTFDQAMALYDPVEHRPLATRFGQDVRVALSFYRSLARWPARLS